MSRLAARFALQLAPLVLGSSQSQLSILIYHRVLPEYDAMRPDEPTATEFDWQMRLLHENFTPLPLLEAVERLQAGTLPRRAVCVTFDDGYADNATVALPILQRYQIPATVFVSTGFLNGGRMWNDSVIEVLRNYEDQTLDLREMELGCFQLVSSSERLAAAENIIGSIKHRDPLERAALVAELEKKVRVLPNSLMMTDDQVRQLASSGITIGAHTVSHPILASISNAKAQGEIHDSKLSLESLLQDAVEVFAYPNGKPGLDYGAEHREMVSEMGFRAAVSTHWGVSSAASDRYQLPRFTPWDRGQLKFALRLLDNYRRGDSLATVG